MYRAGDCKAGLSSSTQVQASTSKLASHSGLKTHSPKRSAEKLHLAKVPSPHHVQAVNAYLAVEAGQGWNIELLPVELLFQILGLLSVKDIKNSRKVNKSWWNITGDDDFWKHVYSRYFGGPADTQPWSAAFQRSYKAYKKQARKSLRLLWAIRNSHIKLVKHLVITKTAPVESKKQKLTSPLYAAAQVGSRDIAAFLIKCEANVNAQSSDSSTSLYIACQNGHKEVVELLLTAGANIEAKFSRESYTPLYIAAQNGKVDVLHLLIKAGADLEASCASGSTALYIAAQQGRLDVVRTLVDAGAQIEARYRSGFTPLYVSSRNGCTEVVKYLLSKGANVEAHDGDGSSSAYVASQWPLGVR